MGKNISKKVLLVADKPIHYRIDLYNLLAKRFQKNISFYFVMDPRFKERNIISVLEGEIFHDRTTFLKGRKKTERAIQFSIDIIRANPDIIVNIGLSLRMVFLIFYAKLFDKKIVIWWSGTKESEKNISWLKKIYRNVIIQFIDGAILYSNFAKKYLLNLKKNISNLLVIGNNTLNSYKYYEKVSSFRINTKRNITNKINILTVGFLVKRKNIITLIKAYENMKRKYENIKLIIVGNGPELNALKEYCITNSVRDVEFKGFIEHKMIYQIYASADIYVHPELFARWPQTYNEAASSELPILISNSSGVDNKYTHKNWPQVLFHPTDQKKLEKLLEMLITNEALRKKLGGEALKDALENDHNAAYRNIYQYLGKLT